MSTKRKPDSILATWRNLRAWPGGSFLFSQLLSRRVPYSGTINARIEDLAPGYAKVRMKDRRSLRNHLRSIHAIALANLGELTTGLAMTTALPPEVRGIPVALHIDYLKKARGTIRAECHCALIAQGADGEQTVKADLIDESGDCVARINVRWSVGPKQRPSD